MGLDGWEIVKALDPCMSGSASSTQTYSRGHSRVQRSQWSHTKHSVSLKPADADKRLLTLYCVRQGDASCPVWPFRRHRTWVRQKYQRLEYIADNAPHIEQHAKSATSRLGTFSSTTSLYVDIRQYMHNLQPTRTLSIMLSGRSPRSRDETTDHYFISCNITKFRSLLSSCR